MHYTSIENIHKVIDPLFMNELEEEYQEATALKTLKSRKESLENLQSKIASLKVLDPAAGSGNFLTETYISLRKLENKIIKELHGSQIILGECKNPIKVTIDQFYGIEINDFAVSVARTALWIAEAQMLQETEDIINLNIDYFPLETYSHIVEENALRMDWEEVVPKEELDYIMGNPPFVGSRLLTTDQRDEINTIFDGYKKIGNLDYVTAWFKIATSYIKGTKIKCAFVSTSSIVEGEMVSILWPNLHKEGLEIDFAYTPFKWSSEANKTAQVFCVIIGFSMLSPNKTKLLFENGQVKIANNINPYLVDGPDIVIKRIRKPLQMCLVSIRDANLQMVEI